MSEPSKEALEAAVPLIVELSGFQLNDDGGYMEAVKPINIGPNARRSVASRLDAFAQQARNQALEEAATEAIVWAGKCSQRKNWPGESALAIAKRIRALKSPAKETSDE